MTLHKSKHQKWTPFQQFKNTWHYLIHFIFNGTNLFHFLHFKMSTKHSGTFLPLQILFNSIHLTPIASSINSDFLSQLNSFKLSQSTWFSQSTQTSPINLIQISHSIQTFSMDAPSSLHPLLSQICQTSFDTFHKICIHLLSLQQFSTWINHKQVH